MSKDELLKKKCVPCEGGASPLAQEDARRLLKDLEGWKLSAEAKTLRAEYVMKDFMAAIEFIQAIAEVGEREDHHPDVHLTGYRQLAIELSTHAIGGLSENDFILAAKIDALPKRLKADSVL
ncbi:MAG: 4a-hydroxytetrahydrobiopterin dehydratase [Candidatus Omnitrophica bacterium]|nr:4a-hydroxytetrahydrobiopterin dehydratase [Candidatus Omnitrophota bacterium]